MRGKLRDEIRSLIEEVVGDIVKDAVLLIKQQHRAIDENTIAEIRKIQPAQVDLTQEMADDIVRKIHGPLTIGKEFSDWIRKEAEFQDVYWTTQIGYGEFAGQMHIILKTNGTLQLQMRDHLGRNLWVGTFVPPDFVGRP